MRDRSIAPEASAPLRLTKSITRWSPRLPWAMVLRSGRGDNMRTTFLCAALVLLFPALAHSQSAGAAMQEFGLLGTWAGECSQSPSPTNNHATYLVTSAGGLQLKYQSGADYEDSVYDILDA